jgi:hypothetical protein
MNVTFERSGGFAGLITTKTIETDKLPSADAQTLQRLIQSADFFKLPSTIDGSGQPDRFQYQITVEDNNRHHSVEVGETSVPGTLRPLIDWLMDKVRQG